MVFVKVLHGMKSDSDSVSQRPQRGDPQIPVDGAANNLVAKFSRLYAHAGREDQFALRVWMRDIILAEDRKCEYGAGKEERKADGGGM